VDNRRIAMAVSLTGSNAKNLKKGKSHDDPFFDLCQEPHDLIGIELESVNELLAKKNRRGRNSGKQQIFFGFKYDGFIEPFFNTVSQKLYWTTYKYGSVEPFPAITKDCEILLPSNQLDE
jgi:hypothetical protein